MDALRLSTARVSQSPPYDLKSKVLFIVNRVVSNPYIREFKKLRRQLQRKRHFKIELCVKLSLSRLFHVDHVVQNTRIALSLARYERFSCKGKE